MYRCALLKQLLFEMLYVCSDICTNRVVLLYPYNSDGSFLSSVGNMIMVILFLIEYVNVCVCDSALNEYKWIRTFDIEWIWGKFSFLMPAIVRKVSTKNTRCYHVLIIY